MKQYLILLWIVTAGVATCWGQQATLNNDEYNAWKIGYVPYKIKAIQSINDYLSIAKDTTLPRARFQDEIIVVESRIGNTIEQVWYGNKLKKYVVLSQEKLLAVFSTSFLETIQDRSKYYYISFDALGVSDDDLTSVEYLNTTWWTNQMRNELDVSSFRMDFYITGSDLHAEASMGDEFIGLPSWIGGFSRVGIVHPNFRLGIQSPCLTQPLWGKDHKVLNGGWGGYGAVNLDNFRFGCAMSVKTDNSYDPSIIDKEDIRYAGYQVYASYSPTVWNESWGTGRVSVGFTYVSARYVRDRGDGVYRNQILPVAQRVTLADSLRETWKDIGSPLVRFEYVTPAGSNSYSTVEFYTQYANLALSTSIMINVNKALGFGILIHENFTNSNVYDQGLYIFPSFRLRF